MMISKFINGNKNARKLSFKNILCIRQDEIGDLCYSLHVFKMLGTQFPKAKLSVLCNLVATPLVTHDPDIDKVFSDWNELSGDYDLIIDLRGNWKSNKYALRHKPLYRLDRGTIRFRNMLKGKHPHEVFTNLEVIEPLIEEQNKTLQPRIFNGHDELGKAERFLSNNKLNSFAVIHTGARRQLRKWPLASFTSLAIFLKEIKQLDVIFCGDNSDLADIEAARKMIKSKTFSVAGEFSLGEFAALVSKAKIFIGNESGPLHIASVSGVPSLGLFGPGEPHVFYPYGERTDYLHHVLHCNPCDQVHCVYPENPCIQRITLEEVKMKINMLLGSK
jgi:ADP-heptose:LPS heptosyltransferase